MSCLYSIPAAHYTEAGTSPERSSTRMKLSLGNATLAVTLAVLSPGAFAQTATLSDRSVDADIIACTSLSTLELPELVALEAIWFDAEPENLLLRPDIDPPEPQPAHCRVRGRIEAAITFEIRLPDAASWNGRYLALGNESSVGMIATERLETALQAGYAAAATDGGHTGSSPAWLTDDARLRDFSYRAVYETSVKAQAIIASFYQQPADYRYFEGCAVGGQQGLMQAQHFPEVFDGIVAGAPLTDFAAAQATSLWASVTAQAPTGQPLLGPQQLQLLNSAAIAQCDTLDGVADGVLEDPRRCNFDPGRLQCGVGAVGSCLSSAQVAAARSIYAGPATGRRTGSTPPPLQAQFPPAARTANNAQQFDIAIPVFDLPGFLPGSELGWQFALNQAPDALALEFFRFAVHSNAAWSWREFELGGDLALAQETSGWIFDVSSGDLSRFAANGGKLIAYHGWSDTVSPPEATLAWFERAARGTAAEAARLFMVPGMQQCGGGSGADEFDMLRALEDWVERGIAPDRIEATRTVDETQIRTRPLCPHPQTARYRGTGSPDQTGNFICAI